MKTLIYTNLKGKTHMYRISNPQPHNIFGNQKEGIKEKMKNIQAERDEDKRDMKRAHDENIKLWQEKVARKLKQLIDKEQALAEKEEVLGDLKRANARLERIAEILEKQKDGLTYEMTKGKDVIQLRKEMKEMTVEEFQEGPL